jgi:hypothetical protein
MLTAINDTAMQCTPNYIISSVYLVSIEMSPIIMVVVAIAGGILIVFLISGFQIFTVLAPGITEEVPVILKENGVCIVEASDDVPREINNCPYEKGEQIIITYKREQPPIESHRPT